MYFKVFLNKVTKLCKIQKKIKSQNFIMINCIFPVKIITQFLTVTKLQAC